MNTKAQPTPEQLTKWREEAGNAYVLDNAVTNKTPPVAAYEAGYLRAKQENEQAIKAARKQGLTEALELCRVEYDALKFAEAKLAIKCAILAIQASLQGIP